jgi:hypothetical protein
MWALGMSSGSMVQAKGWTVAMAVGWAVVMGGGGGGRWRAAAVAAVAVAGVMAMAQVGRQGPGAAACLASDMVAEVPNNRIGVAAIARSGHIRVRNLVAFHHLDLKSIEGAIDAQFVLGAANFSFISAPGSTYVHAHLALSLSQALASDLLRSGCAWHTANCLHRSEWMWRADNNCKSYATGSMAITMSRPPVVLLASRFLASRSCHVPQAGRSRVEQ